MHSFLLKSDFRHSLDDESIQVLIPCGTLFLHDAIARVGTSALQVSSRGSSVASDLLFIAEIVVIFGFINVTVCSTAVSLIPI